MATFDHGVSPRIGQRTADTNGVQLVTLETLPENAYRGQLVYLLDEQAFRVFDGTAWQIPAGAEGGSQTFVGPDMPAADAVGNTWLNTINYVLYVWDGTAWQEVVSNRQALTAQRAIKLANAVETLVPVGTQSSVVVTYDTTQPAAPTQNHIWAKVDTNVVYQWTGSTFAEVTDLDTALGVLDAYSARATPDLTITLYYGVAAPSGLGPEDIGDVWVVTDQNNLVRVWTGADWLDAQVTADSIATDAVDQIHIRDGAVSIEKVNSEFVKSIELQAEQITSGILNSGTVRIQTAEAGQQRTVINQDGMFFYDDAGVARFELPNEGTAVFRGNAEIDYLTVKTLTTLQESLLAEGSTMKLENSIAEPANPPTFEWVNDSIAHATGIPVENLASWTGDGTGDRYWAIDDNLRTVYEIRRNTTTGVLEKYSQISSQQISNELGSGRDIPLWSICYVPPTTGSWGSERVWVVGYDSSDPSTKVQIYGLFLGALTPWEVMYVPNSWFETFGYRVAVGYNSNSKNPYLFYTRTSDGICRYRELDRASFNGTATTVTTWVTTFAYEQGFASTYLGPADTGGEKLWVAGRSKSEVIAISTTGSRDIVDRFKLSATATAGFCWDQNLNRFVAPDTKNDKAINIYGPVFGNAQDELEFNYTWYDPSGPKETPPSEYAFVLDSKQRRQKLKIRGNTVPQGVTHARFYMTGFANGASLVPPFRLQGTSNLGQSEITLAGYNAAGSDAPIENTFGTGTPALMRSALESIGPGGVSAPRWYLKGDGSFRFGNFWGDNTGIRTPHVRRVKTSVVSIPNDSMTTINWDQTVKQDGNWQITSSGVVIPETGLYEIFGQFRFINSANNGYRYIQILYNTSLLVSAAYPAFAGTGVSDVIPASWTGYLNQGEVISLQVWQNHGSAVDSSVGPTDKESCYLDVRMRV
jgi:hypothetical protein